MGKHSHDPVRRVDPVVATARAHIGVTRKNSAVYHEHVVSEHPHASVHRRGIWNPGGAGTFPAHWIGHVDGRLHFHFMFGMLRHGHAVRVVRRVVAVHLMRALFRIRRWMTGLRFRLFYRHQGHSAFWTLTRFSPHNFRMHWARISLSTFGRRRSVRCWSWLGKSCCCRARHGSGN